MALFYPVEAEEDIVVLSKKFASHYGFTTRLDDKTGKLIFEPSRLHNIIPINEYFNNVMGSGNGVISELLPKNIIFYKQVRNGHVVIIEEPKSIKNVTVTISHAEEIKRLDEEGKAEEFGVPDFMLKDIRRGSRSLAKIRFRLAVPTSIFLMKFDNMLKLWGLYFYFSKKPIESLSDALLKPPFSNIQEHGSVCLGGTHIKNPKNLREAVDSIIWSFWNNEFNSDYMDSYRCYRCNTNKKFVRGFFSWAYHTKINPNFVDEELWETSNHTLEESIGRLVGNNDSNNDNRMLYGFKSPELLDLENGRYKTSSRTIVNLDNETQLDRNTEILYNNEEVFLYQVLVKSLKNYLTFMRKDGSITLPIPIDVVRNELADQIRSKVLNEIDEIVYNETITIKKGNNYLFDVDTNGGEAILNVSSIRRLINGLIEIVDKNGNTRLLNSIQNLREFKFELKTKGGTDVEIGKEYIVIWKWQYDSKIYTFSTEFSKFHDFTISKNGRVAGFQLTFVDKNGNAKRFYKSDTEGENPKYSIYTKEEFDQEWACYNIAHIHGFLVASLDRHIFINNDKDKMILRDEYFGRTIDISILKKIFEKVENEDVSGIDIPGIEGNFCVIKGGEYVIPDWNRPAAAFNPKIISAIKLTEKGRFLTIDVVDKITNEKENIILADFYTNRIKNMVWPIIAKYDKFELGNVYKFKNVKQHPSFNMRTCKKLMAIVYVMNRPLALFNDNTTLFLDTYKDNVLPAKNVNVTPEIKQPEIQSGDMVVLNGERLGFIRSSSEFYMCHAEKRLRTQYYYSYDKIDFFGVPLPRASSVRNRRSGSSVCIWPHITGGFELIDAEKHQGIQLYHAVVNNYIRSYTCFSTDEQIVVDQVEEESIEENIEEEIESQEEAA